MTQLNTEAQDKDTTLDKILTSKIEKVFIGNNEYGGRYIFQVSEEAKQALLQWRDKAVVEARKEERTKARQLYAKRNPQYTRKWIADLLGISRPTLNKWLKDPELFTVGAIRKLGALKETPNED